MAVPPVRSATSPGAALLYGGAAAGVLALHLATNGTLGFHIDELYYLACGRHPALGYVDFPPVVPLLARLETSLLGVTPWRLRLLPSLVGGLLVALSGAYVRRLGGSLRLQGMALLIAATAPLLLSSNWVFQTVAFDELIWMVALYWFLCLVIDRRAEYRPRYWIALGVTLGIGLEVKYTIVGLMAGIGLAVLLTPSLRQELRTSYPWIAAAITLLLWTPNLVWQARNGFPSLTYVTNHHGSIASGGGVVTYLVEFAVILFLLLPLWVAGMMALFRSRSLRPVGICCAVPLVLFLFVGKSYYAASTVPIVMGQGLLAVSHLERPRLRSAFTGAVVAASVLGFMALLRLILPITPADRLHATGLDAKSQLFRESVGWVDVSNEMTELYRSLPETARSQTVIISRFYGVAGALQLYGDPKLLPDILSPQLSYFYWVPPQLTATSALMVGYEPSDVTWLCASPDVIAHLTVPYQVVNLEQGAPVTFCQLEQPLPTIWNRLRNFS